jgi:hypothetical protein
MCVGWGKDGAFDFASVTALICVRALRAPCVLAVGEKEMVTAPRHTCLCVNLQLGHPPRNRRGSVTSVQAPVFGSTNSFAQSSRDMLGSGSFGSQVCAPLTGDAADVCWRVTLDTSIGSHEGNQCTACRTDWRG